MSDDMVTKSEAWDALSRIPPKVERELSTLRPVAQAARNVGLYCGRHAPKDSVTVDVPVAYIDEIRALFGMDPYE